MVIPSYWLVTSDCLPRVVPQTAVLLGLNSVVYWWMYLLAAYLRIYPPPVQHLWFQQRQAGRFVLVVDSYESQSLPLVLCIIVYLNPSYVQISNECVIICRFTYACSSSAGKLHPQCPQWAALQEKINSKGINSNYYAPLSLELLLSTDIPNWCGLYFGSIANGQTTQCICIFQKPKDCYSLTGLTLCMRVYRQGRGAEESRKEHDWQHMYTSPWSNIPSIQQELIPASQAVPIAIQVFCGMNSYRSTNLEHFLQHGTYSQPESACMW